MAQYKVPKARGLRVRERAPKYEVLHPYEPVHVPPVYHVTVADRGRLVLPAEIREKLKIHDGDPVALTLHDDGLVTFQTREVALERFTGMFKHLAKPGRLASDELIAERRREARMEDRKFREWKALHRRMKRR
jgi:AbrB family looped-hinge helix DNA binding protein